MSNVWLSKPPLGSVIDWENPLSQGLVGCWLMNEGRGNKIINLVNNRTGGTFVGVTWGTKEKGTCIQDNSDPVSQYVDFGNNFALPKFTILAWFRLTSANIADYQIISKFGGSVGNSAYAMGIRVSAAFNPVILRGVLHNGSTSKEVIGTKNLYLNLNQLCCTFDTVTLAVYVNGKLDNSTTTVVQPMLTSTDSFQLLQSGTGTAAQLQGIMFNAFVYNRALSPQEIQSLYIAPYQFIYKPSYRFYSTPAVSGYGMRSVTIIES